MDQNEKTKVLFVDDEANILESLKRMMRPLRNEFESFFVENATEALNILQRIGPFDIVVSDMRMPVMSGAALLEEVQKKYPYCIRIILSGQADDVSILQTVGVAHQFLSKPCDPEKLKTVLLRSGRLHQKMMEGNLKDMISGLEKLPSLPSLYLEVQKAMSNPECSLDDIGTIISRDLAMTAKILQLVNSSFFGFYTKVEDPSRAVKLLGLETIKALILVSKIFSEITISKESYPIQKLWTHSLSVGMLAKAITMNECHEKSVIDCTYTTGVLHDIGRLILVSKMDNYDEVIGLAMREHISLSEAEKMFYSVTHSDMGAYLLGLWGFPSDTVDAVVYHHHIDASPIKAFSPALAVHVANALYYRYRPDDNLGAPPPLNEGHIIEIGLGDKIPVWQDLCRSAMEQHNNY